MAEFKTKILLVDDRPENLLALERSLEGEGYVIHKALSGREALELLLVNDYAVALLDVQMPDMNGFELAELMRSKASTREIPIIFVTAGAIDPSSTFKGYEAGAVDFLYKPLDMRIVKGKLRIFSELASSKNMVQEQIKKLETALRSRDDFLSIASHELKTPMTSLRLNTQMLIRKLPEETKFGRVLTSMEGQIHRLNKLVDDLLDSTRIRSGKLSLSKENVDFSGLVKEAVEHIKPELTKQSCELSLQIPPHVNLECDPLRIEQIVTNLLSNVARYAPDSQVSVSVDEVPKKVRLVVEDKGPGIPANELPMIFNRFERGSQETVAGLGLGLFIVKEIVELHGGTITVDSATGNGSKFTVELPK